jgi:hypothetical protein
MVFVALVGLVTSLGLAGWALRERDRLVEVQNADWRRLQARLEQLQSAAPEAVPGLRAALKEEQRPAEARHVPDDLKAARPAGGRRG